MPDGIPEPAESSDYDELTEDLKAIRAYRDKNAKEYQADPEAFLSKRRRREYPGFTFASPNKRK